MTKLQLSEVASIFRSNVVNGRNKTTFVRYKVILWDKQSQLWEIKTVIIQIQISEFVWYHKEGLNSLFCVVPLRNLNLWHAPLLWSLLQTLSSSASLTTTYLISEVRHETVTSPPANSGAPMLFHGPLCPKDNQPCILESVRARNTSASPNNSHYHGTLVKDSSVFTVY